MGLRASLLTKPIFAWAQTALPALSDTEREAIEAGDTWWDADLFTGNPRWQKLLAEAPAKLSAEEQAFLDGPVETFCAMIGHAHTAKDALAKGAITQEEADALAAVDDLVAKVIAVDDFAPEELTHHDTVTTIR
jgi:hypothetical protein